MKWQDVKAGDTLYVGSSNPPWAYVVLSHELEGHKANMTWLNLVTSAVMPQMRIADSEVGDAYAVMRGSDVVRQGRQNGHG